MSRISLFILFMLGVLGATTVAAQEGTETGVVPTRAIPNQTYPIVEFEMVNLEVLGSVFTYEGSTMVEWYLVTHRFFAGWQYVLMSDWSAAESEGPGVAQGGTETTTLQPECQLVEVEGATLGGPTLADGVWAFGPGIVFSAPHLIIVDKVESGPNAFMTARLVESPFTTTAFGQHAWGYSESCTPETLALNVEIVRNTGR